MLLAHACQIEFTAALVRPATLKPGGQHAVLTLGGLVDRAYASQGADKTTGRFYQPAMATGLLAARLGTAQAGEAVMGVALFTQSPLGVGLLITEAARLSPDPDRLARDSQGGVLLKDATLRARVRGLLMAAPALSRLRDETPVCNVTLGLTPQREPGETNHPHAPLIPIELALYGSQASRLATLPSGHYLAATGLLQRRLIGEHRRLRLEIKTFEALHPTRALI